MSFINAFMLAGAGFFLVPLGIHLLFRSRVNVVSWGANHLLDDVIRTQSRRMRLREILLLLMRITIPILLAIALAGPLITGNQASTSSQPISVVIVLDDSRSMLLSDESGKTSFEKAIDRLQEILRGLNRQDEVSIVTTTHPSIKRGWSSPSRALIRLASMHAEGTSEPWNVVMLGVESLFTDAQLDSRCVIVLSDFLDPQDQSLAPTQSDWETVWIPLADEHSAASTNASVDSISVDGLPTLRRDHSLSITIRNQGDQDVRRLTVTSDQNEIYREDIEFAEDQVREVVFPWKPQRAGQLCIKARVDGSDALKADNVRMTIISVVDQIPVGIIDHTATHSASLLQTSSGFVRAALGLNASSRFTVTTMTPQEWVRVPQTDWPPIMIWTSGLFEDASTETWEQFFVRGGNLIVFDHEDLADSHIELSTVSNLRDHIEFETATETIRRAASEWLSDFGDPNNGPLSSIRVRRLRSLVPSSTSSVVWQTVDDAPLLLESQSTGSGKIFQFAISSTPEDSSLPLRPAFVALLSRMIERGSKQTNHPPFDPGERAAWLPDSDTQRPSALFQADQTPNASGINDIERIAVSRIDDQRFTFDVPRQTGLITLRDQSHSKSSTVIQQRVVSTSPTESNISPSFDSTLDVLQGRFGGFVTSKQQDLSREQLISPGSRKGSQPIWPWVLAVVVLLMLAESFLSARISPASGSTQAQSHPTHAPEFA
ncbi:MAG: BatA domain-containing protein [Planctomycetota bacterium]